ncbi:hypothetical protein K7X08_004461 [Anisodus acutangulus]|uniref:Uncharacterized protein n=1 Tax=Anisodus acutangulus TaxID=402998 RepID=A0A9Q1MDY4_9SOLA|nr:hypothetical protein K7X08_004461 [Anisodus acutangulus]
MFFFFFYFSPVHSNRTLLDIIRDDPNMSSRKNRKTWKHFRNKLRLKPDISIQHHNNPIMSPRLSSPYDVEISASGSRSRNVVNSMSVGVENENGEEEESEGVNAREEIGVKLEDQSVRMSLMALLTENDGDGLAYMI